MPAHDRVQFTEACIPGLLAVTPGVSEATEWLRFEGQVEAYSSLPYPGGLMAQPARLFDAFSVIRETKAGARLREARNQALDWQRNTRGGGEHGGPD